MAIHGVQVSLTANVAAVLSVASTGDAIAGQNIGIMPCAVDLYLGDDTVTTATGAKLPAGTPFSTQIDPRESLYAVAGVNTTVHVFRQGV